MRERAERTGSRARRVGRGAEARHSRSPERHEHQGLIADDHNIVVTAARPIETQPDIEVVGTASDGREASARGPRDGRRDMEIAMTS